MSDICVLGVVNGCFDILHPGHVRFLEHCRSVVENRADELGGTCALNVHVNTDRSYKALRGKSPVFSQDDRVYLLQSLSVVDAVYLFDTDRFLFQGIRNYNTAMDCPQEIHWFKGRPYCTEDDLSREEVDIAAALGVRIHFAGSFSHHSSSAIKETLKNLQSK
jgi:cytidyltransferase-like protein